LEINLTGVEFEGLLRPVQGGLCLSFTPHADETPLPELRAGDEVSVLTEARLPQVFRDEGVFDRRAYLAQQKIDLVAALRAPELIERIATSQGALSRLARVRRRLRDEIDSLCGESPQTAAVLRAMLLGDRSLWSRGFQKLDVVALTHAHQDHLGGLAAILENFRVARLWIGREVSSAALVRLEALARARNIPVEHELRGKAFDWGGVRGEFLWPESALESRAPAPKNDDSLVLRLQYGDKLSCCRETPKGKRSTRFSLRITRTR
jgi:hypothetical protein